MHVQHFIRYKTLFIHTCLATNDSSFIIIITSLQIRISLYLISYHIIALITLTNFISPYLYFSDNNEEASHDDIKTKLDEKDSKEVENPNVSANHIINEG